MNDYSSLPVREIERLALNIKAGEWAVERNRPIATLLGSCVAVCLFDSAVPIAGMNHFMLPNLTRRTHGDTDALLAGDASMEALLNAMLTQGAAKHRLRAKAFGGGTVIESSGQSLAVGKRNADFTREWLEREHIPIVASDFLGPWSRKVLLVPSSGDAYSRRMTSSLVSAEAIKREEDAYAKSLTQTPAATTEKRIELF